jgi:hypothetical protein
MISTLLIGLIAVLSFVVTARRGPGATFAYVMLPAMLLAFTVSPIAIYKLPDVTTTGAVGYGTLLGLVAIGWRPPFKLGLIDFGVLSLMAVRIISGTVNGQLWTGVSYTGAEVLLVGVPYLLARTAFIDRHWRLQAAKVITIIAVSLVPICLIEFRLWPLTYSRSIMAPLGLTSVDWAYVHSRFGFFRAQGSFCHPIDLGNGAALLFIFVIVLATSAGKSLRTWWVALGAGSTLLMSLTSMSFTSFAALAAILGLFGVCRLARPGAFLLVPAAIAGFLFFADLTREFIVNEPVKVAYVHGGSSADGSYYTRHLIVHNTWLNEAGTMGASKAGLFGYGNAGEGYDTRHDFGLESIDNSFLVFVLERGWLYLALFLGTGFAAAVLSTRALLRLPTGASRTPLAAAISGIVGTMLGMYTVFFGFIYAMLFWMLLGLLASMLREIRERTGDAEPVQLEADQQARSSRGAFA